MKELVPGVRPERTNETVCQLKTWDVGYIVRGSGEEGGGGERRLVVSVGGIVFDHYQDFQEKYYLFAMGTDRINGRILCRV